MNVQRTAGAAGTPGRMWRQYPAAAYKAALIFAAASVFARGFGAVVERLTTSDTTARASIDGVRESQPILSGPHVVDRPYDAQAVTDRSLAYVFDGWYDEPPAATTGTARMPDQAGLPTDAAPNELRNFGN